MSAPSPASTVSVVGALARADGRKLLTHPAFLAGGLMATLGSLSFLIAAWSGTGTWDEDGWTAWVGVVILGILTLIATNLAALRDRREHTVEQHGALPVQPPTRIRGLLAATVWPAAAAAVLLLAVIVLAASRGLTMDTVGVVLLVERVWSVVLLGVVGIALAVWVPRSFVAAFVAFALFFVSPGETPRSWHSVAPFTAMETTALATWHLVYLIGLTGVLGALTLLRWGRRPVVLVVGAVSLLVTATAAAMLIDRACTSAGTCLL